MDPGSCGHGGSGYSGCIQLNLYQAIRNYLEVRTYTYCEAGQDCSLYIAALRLGDTLPTMTTLSLQLHCLWISCRRRHVFCMSPVPSCALTDRSIHYRLS